MISLSESFRGELAMITLGTMDVGLGRLLFVVDDDFGLILDGDWDWSEGEEEVSEEFGCEIIGTRDEALVAVVVEVVL